MKITKVILAILFFGILIAPACKNNKRTNQIQNQTVTTADNSRTSLDWSGVYTGVVPCADCDGIQTTLTLRNNNTYELRTRYLGQDNQEQVTTGNFTWNNNSNRITLSNITDAPNQFQVGENVLMQLDMQGNRINSTNNYSLAKVSDLVEKYWRLTEIDGTIPQSLDGNREAHMTLRVENSRVNGSGGCNTFNGSYVIESRNNIRFSKVASTMMACPGVETEGKFLKELENVRHYSLSNDKLELKDGNNRVLARFEAVYM